MDIINLGFLLEEKESSLMTTALVVGVLLRRNLILKKCKDLNLTIEMSATTTETGLSLVHGTGLNSHLPSSRFLRMVLKFRKGFFI
jgi:hypothetical protein